MNILDLISKDTGIIYQKKSSREWCGSCFHCGGDDRLSIIPSKNHYVCRKCGSAGDSIQFVKKFHSKNYYEACQYLGINPDIKFSSLNSATEKPGQNEIIWKPQELNFPSNLWQQQAMKFLLPRFKYLNSKLGKKYRKFLNDRGINDDTIKKARFGWNGRNFNFNRESWGLVPEIAKNGKKKQIWMPIGLIIAQFHNKKIVRLQIRQENPLTINRFVNISGSYQGFFDYRSHVSNINISLGQNNKPNIITESFLDGWLMWQESKGLCNIYAGGSSTARPDIKTHKLIKRDSGLLNLDNDESGKNEIDWWAQYYPNLIPYFSQKKKDPGEDWQAGVDIRKWIKKGLKLVDAKPGTHADNKGSQEIHYKTFKDKILAKQKEKSSININQKPISEKKSILKNLSTNKSFAGSGKLCRHNKYCMSLKNKICLRNKKNIFNLTKCPKEFWKIWTSKTGFISEVILGPGIKK